MAKRNKIELPSIVEDEEIINEKTREIQLLQKELYTEDALEIEEPVPYNTNEQSSKVRLQSVFPAHLRLTGQVTGQLYEWKSSGDVVEVDELDAVGLLEGRVGNSSCCGGNKGGNRLLQKVV